MKVTTLVLSVLSFIWLTAHRLLIESISECRCVQSVAELTVRNTLILSENKDISNA